jgi:uncharacterized protein
MLHIVKSIERRTGACIRSATVRASLLRAATIATALGLALAASSAVPAQEPRPGETAPVAADVTTDTVAFDAAGQAEAMLAMMDAGDFTALRARFDERMAAALTEEQLRQVWASLTQFGASKGRGEAQSTTQGDIRLARIPLRYENATIDALFAFAADGKLTGLRFIPAETSAAASPPVDADAKYTEAEVRIGDEATGLPATLTMPKHKGRGKGSFPAVVLVHGSGPHDRDSTIGPNKPFLDIARGLAEHGIAVLRYEKRSKARPQDLAQSVTIDSETTDDAVAAVATLRAQPGIDAKRVFVLGHSQGGMMAPRIGIRDPQIAGLILLAAPSRPLLDILIEQNKRMAVLNDGKTDDAEHTAIAKVTAQVAAVRRGEDVSGMDAPLGAPGAYWRSVEAVDAVAEAGAAKQPLLILQGAQDIQVVDADWQRWRAAFHDDARVTFKLYESLSHLAIPGEGTPKDYSTAGHVAPELIADVAAWIGQQHKRKGR